MPILVFLAAALAGTAALGRQNLTDADAVAAAEGRVPVIGGFLSWFEEFVTESGRRLYEYPVLMFFAMLLYALLLVLWVCRRCGANVFQLPWATRGAIATLCVGASGFAAIWLSVYSGFIERIHGYEEEDPTSGTGVAIAGFALPTVAIALGTVVMTRRILGAVAVNDEKIEFAIRSMRETFWLVLAFACAFVPVSVHAPWWLIYAGGLVVPGAILWLRMTYEREVVKPSEASTEASPDVSDVGSAHDERADQTERRRYW